MPSLTGLDAPTFGENTVNATPQVLDAAVVFTDVEGDFDGGTLTVSGLLAEDTVSVRNQGTGAGQIGLSGANVTYEGVIIGTLAGGAGATLTITFNAAATSASIDALIQNLTYANVSDTPTASRDLLLNITDAAGNDLGASGSPSFTDRTGAANPFDGVDVGFYSTPTFADLDGDGDLDAVVGESAGALLYFENTGTDVAPVFVQQTGAANPFNGVDVGYRSAPTFADLDGDGDLDAVVGEDYGRLLYFENTGTDVAPVFTARTGAANPFNGRDVGFNSTPTFADLDGDGDLDAVVGDAFGRLNYFRNTGTDVAPVFVQQTGAANPFNGVDLGYRSTPTLADLDGDGDLDAVVGESAGTLLYFENTGTDVAPVFVQQTGADNPLNGVHVGYLSVPAFADLDGDGNLDTVVGDNDGNLNYLENTTPHGQTITVTVTAQADAPEASGLPTDVTVTEDVASNLNLSAVTLSDPDSSGSITVTLTASAGTMTATTGGGVTVTNSGTGAITLTGTAAAIDTFLNTASAIQYTGASNASGDDAATVTVTANDGSGAVTLGTVNVDITAVDDPMTLTGVATSATFAENTVNATPQLLDADVTFDHADNDYDGGTLTVSGLLAEDTVSVNNQGTGAGQIGLSGANVTYGGGVIGTLAGGAGATLTITFTAAATSTAIDALLQNLTYANSSDTPTASRTLTINVTDAAGEDLGADSPSFTHVTGAANPFDGFYIDRSADISFGDLDADGDLDAVVGEGFGLLRYFENTGTTSDPVFVEQSAGDNPFNGFDVGYTSSPEFADLDDDGDLDLLVGENGGALLYFENVGSALAPTFVARTGLDNPLPAVDFGFYADSTLGDLDNDGDLDLIVGFFDGMLRYFENTGAAAAPEFTELTGGANPLNGVDVGGISTPDLIDLDGDGDLDLLVGAQSGALRYFENTGTTAAPVFTERTGGDNPFDGFGLGPSGNTAPEAFPSFADLDGDGDLDAMIGHFYGSPAYLENTTVGPPSITVTVTAEAEPIVLTGSGTLTGGGVGDTLTGLGTDDTLSGLSGDDILSGGGGNDTILGGWGADTISGGTGDDVLNGEYGDDILNGGDGADVLNGGSGADAMNGGKGNDTYYVDNVGDTVSEAGGNGIDTINTRISWTLGVGFENLTLLNSGNANINGTGNGSNNILTGNSFANTLSGMAGDDTIHGGGGADILNGGNGADTLNGDAGNDTLNGDANNDILNGGDGNDTLNGGSGADVMSGGLGNDIYVVDNLGDTVDETGGGGTDEVQSRVSYTLVAGVENLTLMNYSNANIDGTGSDDDNVITGNNFANVLSGAGGGDTLNGGGGSDTLLGGAGKDRLDGGVGVDTLNGGDGNDILTGGLNGDTFLFGADSIHLSSLGQTRDTDRILDLAFATGDRIDLGGIDADSTLGGDQAFTFVTGFTNVAGQAVLTFVNGVTILNLDVDGDGVSDLRIEINGDVTGTTTNLYTGGGDGDGGWVL